MGFITVNYVLINFEFKYLYYFKYRTIYRFSNVVLQTLILHTLEINFFILIGSCLNIISNFLNICIDFMLKSAKSGSQSVMQAMIIVLNKLILLPKRFCYSYFITMHYAKFSRRFFKFIYCYILGRSYRRDIILAVTVYEVILLTEKVDKIVDFLCKLYHDNTQL